MSLSDGPCGGGIKRVYYLYQSWCNCMIPPTVKIGKGLRLPHPMGIVISAYAELGDFCTIMHNVTIGSDEHKENYRTAPRIGDRVYIGAGAVVIGDIEIGDGVIIGANATVTKSVPAGRIVVGNNRVISGMIERDPHPHFERKEI